MKLRKTALLLAAASLFPIGALAAPASAAVAQPGKCTKLATKSAGSKINATLTGCTPTTATGGKGTGSFTSTGAPAGTLNIAITWAGGKGTTKANVTFTTQKTNGKCPTGTTSRIKIAGKVTAGTGVAVKTFKKGQPVSGSVCIGSKGYTLEPTTALKF